MLAIERLSRLQGEYRVMLQRLPNSVLLWLALVLGCAATEARAKEAEKSVQAVIVFDVSGSMRQSDPNRLSVSAAQLFTNLSKPGDALGLAAFSDSAVGLMPLTPGLDTRARESLQQSLAKLRFDGQTTNLVAALEAGLAAFPQQADSSHRRLVLLLTDGQLDLGKNRQEEEAAAREHIVSSLIPEYHRRDISLYTIAFTSGADHGFLKEMADASAGDSRFIEDAQSLHQAFSQIFIGAHESETFPLEQSSIQIDASIQDLSLVFAKSTPDERIALLSPQRRIVQASDTPEGTTWQSTPAYDLVRMHEPQPGTWQIDRSGDVQSGVGIIAESTIKLQVELDAAFTEVGTPVAIRAFLEDQSQTPASVKHEDGQTLTAELAAPDGSTSSLTLAPDADGSFSVRTTPLAVAGKYSLIVSATTPTLQRQRTRTFEVHRECLHGRVSPWPPVKVLVTTDSSCPAFKSLSIEAEHTTSGGIKQRTPLRTTQPGHFEADLPTVHPGQQAVVHVIARGETTEGAFTLTKGPWSLPTAPTAAPPPTPTAPAAAERKRNVLLSAGRTLLEINAGLLLVGVLGYAMYRAIAQIKKRRSWKKP